MLPSARLEAETPALPCVPLPVSATVLAPELPSLAMVSVPVLAPTALGEKRTLIVHVPLTASVEQVFVETAKSPDAVALLITSA